MKCPKCAANQKYSAGMRCRCGYRFTLDPKTDGFTDGKMLALIRRASAHDTYFFTKNQLFAEYCRLRYFSPKIPFIVAIMSAAIAAYLLLNTDHFGFAWISPAVASAISLLMVVSRLLASLPGYSEFEQSFRKWRNQKAKTLEKLLDQPTLQKPPPEWQEPDIYDYGVERILIVQHDLLVDLLVKNGFHATERTLVLSQSKYPNYLVSHACRFLRENSDLPVFLLHDATVQGEGMSAQVASRGELPISGHRVIDLGIFREDVPKLNRLHYLKLKSRGYELPVDMLPYGFLAAGLGTSLTEGIPFAAVVERYKHSGGNGDDSGSFG